MSSSEFVLFAQHGWADTNATIAAFARQLVSPSTPVIAPNLGWWRTWIRIEPLIDYVEALAIQALEQYPHHSWRIIGHSMGGLIWIELLHRHPEWLSRLHSLVLVGSPVGGSDLGRIIDPWGLGIAIAKDLGANRRELAAAIAQQIPTLVVAGDRDGGSDGTVPVECTKVPRANFVLLPRLSHATLKHHPQVGEAIQSFWQQPVVGEPEADTPSLRLIQRFQRLPGMTDAHYRVGAKARPILDLEDGHQLRLWISSMRIYHVLVAQGDRYRYAGFTGWPHTNGLRAVLSEVAPGYDQDA